MAKQVSYALQGLDCANCAAKIEDTLHRKGLTEVTISFATGQIQLPAKQVAEAQSVIDDVESGVKIVLPTPARATTRSRSASYSLEGLDCANCAAKIEDALHRKGLTEAAISFATNQIILPAGQVAEAQAVIDGVEPGVKIVLPTLAEASGGSTATEAAVAAMSTSAVRSAPAADQEAQRRRRVAEIIVATVLLVVGTIYHDSLHVTAVLDYTVFVLAYLLVGRDVVWAALRNMGRGQFFDETFLMTLATLGAFAIHELPEAVAVMLFYSVGEYFQDRAVDSSRRSIRALLEVRPDHANLRRGGAMVQVSPEEVAVGDEIVVRPGERIPLDGEVIEGSTYVDTSALTGESVPRSATVGDTVLAGAMNTRGLIAVRVTREFGESSIAKVMQLVEQAAARKAPTERAITTFSRNYTPVVVGLALLIALIPPLVIPGAVFSDWLQRALILLVISCPCALVVSVPLSYFGGLGAASRRGILIKGGNYLDALAKVETVVWDKTGTLTQGQFKVVSVDTANGFSQDEVLALAAHAELHSSHPIATSIQDAYGGTADAGTVMDYEEVAGHGIRAKVNDRLVLAGNERLLAREGITPVSDANSAATVVQVAVDGVWAGRIAIADEPKPNSAAAVRELRSLGVRRQVMLTGDDRRVAEAVAVRLGLDEVRANLLPEGKVAAVEEIDREQKAGQRPGTLAFVGDGINDAPVLTRADVGIAMGGLGSDAAIEAADVVIMDDNPAKLATGVALARRTRAIVQQNIAFALGVKVLVMALGAAGMANMWMAVFADVGVSLLAVLNATRVMRGADPAPKAEVA